MITSSYINDKEADSHLDPVYRSPWTILIV